MSPWPIFTGKTDNIQWSQRSCLSLFVNASQTSSTTKKNSWKTTSGRQKVQSYKQLLGLHRECKTLDHMNSSNQNMLKVGHACLESPTTLFWSADWNRRLNPYINWRKNTKRGFVWRFNLSSFYTKTSWHRVSDRLHVVSGCWRARYICAKHSCL